MENEALVASAVNSFSVSKPQCVVFLPRDAPGRDLPVEHGGGGHRIIAGSRHHGCGHVWRQASASRSLGGNHATK